MPTKTAITATTAIKTIRPSIKPIGEESSTFIIALAADPIFATTLAINELSAAFAAAKAAIAPNKVPYKPGLPVAKNFLQCLRLQNIQELLRIS